MAIITIPRKIFEREIGKLDEKMQERIALLGTPVEKLTNEELQLEIFPNRPDMLSYQGFKRALLAFLEKKTGLQKYKLNKPEKNYVVKVDSSMKDVRPYTACAIVKGLKFDSEKIREIIEIQEKLHATLGRKRKKMAIGIYPLDKIKLPIKFKALEPDKIRFIPLESEREMSGLEILQKHPTGKEYASLLAGKAKFPVFMDADNKILSMPPIINSRDTGRITEKTRNIFIECSGYHLETLKKCLNILASSLADMGGRVFEMTVDYGMKKLATPDFSTEKAEIKVENANKLLGLELSKKEIKKLLERMGHNYDPEKSIVEIAPWRTDILSEVDLIEDVAIAYGYDKFVPEIPEISTIGEENPIETMKRKTSDVLSGLGMQEVSNYHLTIKKDQFDKMGEKDSKSSVEVEDSKTDYNILRKDLTHYLLKIFSENVKNDYPQKIFEIGKVFQLKEEPEETENLAVAVSPGNFTELKQVINYLSEMVGIKLAIKEPKENPNYFIKGRVAEISLNNHVIGFIGEIHPKILKNWKIRMPVALFEISFEKIAEEIEKSD